MGVFYQLQDSNENRRFCELRERAEAGVLLLEGLKALETKHGIAVTRERTRHESRLPLHKKAPLIVGLFYRREDSDESRRLRCSADGF